MDQSSLASTDEQTINIWYIGATTQLQKKNEIMKFADKWKTDRNRKDHTR